MPTEQELAKAPIRPAAFSTESKYVQWVNEWRRSNDQRYRCRSASNSLVEAFPELRLVRGWAHVFYDEGVLGTRTAHYEHWWCEAPDGTVVDATNEQWISDLGGEIFGYEEYDPQFHGPEPIGKCMCCGMLIFPGDNGDCTWACTPECESELREYYRF